jgi:tRNA A-37 threonylcarbamoyl transferase component Bud32/tetratricopeptide (TPR) repeat protein
MHIICPHCQGHIELAEPATLDDISCPTCGSSFRLERGSTTGWSPGATGRKLGKFELIDLVGAGAFGSVFMARDPELDRVVAIKVPRTGSLGSAENMDRFLREARSVAQLRHPAIVPVYEVSQHEGVPFLVSEFVRGTTLADLLTAHRPTFRDTARLIATVAGALQYAHEQGVVHRDVKPSNIMLDEKGEPHLMDFGLAKRDAGEITMTIEGQVLGTPAYMSPEQAGGEAHSVDGRSDVYSLGVVLYQLLTGELPFRGNARMLIQQVLHDEPRPPRALNDRVPRDLDTICLKAMAKEPGQRYASAAELAGDLERFLNNQPIHARPPNAWYRFRKFAGRHRPLVGGVTATFLALLLGVVGTSIAWAKAQRESDRARNAEREQRIELARTSAQAARLASQRGQWQSALDHYSKALELGHEDEVGLRLRRLDCYLALMQYPAVLAELDALAARNDLGRHAGTVLLWQAEAAMWSPKKDGKDPLELVRMAIARGLPPAEEAYARAWSETSVPKATRLLEKAMELDPFHPRAYSTLITLLFLQGRLDEARLALARATLVLPDSPQLIVTQALLAAIAGDLAAAKALVDRLAPQIGPDATAIIRFFLKPMHLLAQEELFWKGLDRPARFAFLVELFDLTPHFLKVLGQSASDGRTAWGDLGYMKVPLLGPLLELLPFSKGGLNMGAVNAFLDDDARLSDVLGRLLQACPEGTFYCLRGLALNRLGRLHEAEEALRLALQTPTFSRCQSRARYELAVVQDRLAWRAKTFEGRKAWHAKALDNVRQLAAAKVAPVLADGSLVRLANSAGDHALALHLVEVWQQLAPGDRALEARLIAEGNLGAHLRLLGTVRTALQKRPGNEDLLLRRLMAEHNLGWYVAALGTANEALQQGPKHKALITAMQGAFGDSVKAQKRALPVAEAKVLLLPAFRLACAGDPVAAVAKANDLVRGKELDGPRSYALACVYARAAGAFRPDSKLPAAQRAKLAEQYAKRALDLLDKARSTGLFKELDWATMADVRTGPDLAPIRTRAEFRKLLENLGRK